MYCFVLCASEIRLYIRLISTAGDANIWNEFASDVCVSRGERQVHKCAILRQTAFVALSSLPSRFLLQISSARVCLVWHANDAIERD